MSDHDNISFTLCCRESYVNSSMCDPSEYAVCPVTQLHSLPRGGEAMEVDEALCELKSTRCEEGENILYFKESLAVNKKNLFLKNEYCFRLETLPLISDVYEPPEEMKQNYKGSSSLSCLDAMDQLKLLCLKRKFKLSFTNRLIASKCTGKRKLRVKCLYTMEDLRRICEDQGLQFNECDNLSIKKKKLTNEHNLKQCVVQCLQTMDDITKTCEKLGLNFNTLGKFYEVDLIWDDRIEKGEKNYLVKWKNYGTQHNTWEPKCHLSGCKDMLEYYEALKSSRKITPKLLKYFVQDAVTRKPYDILVFMKLYAICYNTSEEKVNSLNLSITQYRKKAKELLNFPPSKLKCIAEKLLDLMKFAEKRKRVLVHLKEWEAHINSVSKSAFIEVENNVDLEVAPTDFVFISDYINNAVCIPEDPVAFCCCDNCYQNRKSCCPHDSDGHFAYSRFGRLELRPGYPIYECNKLCKCESNCVNRVVQHGQKVKVAIFKTANGCGWGLKTLETIEEGQFVLEYLGEIITSEAAEARGKLYDYIGRSYLFDLDYGVDACGYTVDAGHMGNAAHFINHSCDPNLHVFAVWINQPDPNLPRLAFFAKRKIRRGEELTFDYKMEKRSADHIASESSEGHRILCKCNSKKCRRYLF